MISKEKADFIRSLADANGYIEPKRVIEAARDPNCILHGEFEWDRDLAAEQCWIDQARALIRFVKLEVEIERKTIVAPFYVPWPDRAPRSRTYMQLSLAAKERETAQKILMEELDRVAAAIRRALQVAAVLGLSDKLNEFLEDVHLLKTKAERKREEKKDLRGKGRGKTPASRRSTTTRPEAQT